MAILHASGSTCGEADPVCFIQWKQLAIAAAAQEGPHLDSNGPRTVDSLEAALVGAGGAKKAIMGVLKFATDNELHRVGTTFRKSSPLLHCWLTLYSLSISPVCGVRSIVHVVCRQALTSLYQLLACAGSLCLIRGKLCQLVA